MVPTKILPALQILSHVPNLDAMYWAWQRLRFYLGSNPDQPEDARIYNQRFAAHFPEGAENLENSPYFRVLKTKSRFWFDDFKRWAFVESRPSSEEKLVPGSKAKVAPRTMTGPAAARSPLSSPPHTRRGLARDIFRKSIFFA